MRLGKDKEHVFKDLLENVERFLSNEVRLKCFYDTDDDANSSTIFLRKTDDLTRYVFGETRLPIVSPV